MQASRPAAGFRPFTGPASLKRIPQGIDHDAAGSFRPFTGPASLKLRFFERREAVRRRFRPFTGPASLKQILSAILFLSGASFRPFTGPASLKHERLIRTGRISSSGFPALHRAGLIEAATWPRSAAGLRSLFPALHRAGLIEASRSRAIMSMPAAVSGPSQGRPH